MQSRAAATGRQLGGTGEEIPREISEKGVDMRPDLPYLCAPVRPERNSPNPLRGLTERKERPKLGSPIRAQAL